MDWQKKTSIFGFLAASALFSAALLVLRRGGRGKKTLKKIFSRPSVFQGRGVYAVNPHSIIRERVVIAMVGLPARGKSYMSKAIIRYLTYLGCPAKMFNAGSKRRIRGLAGTDSSFFDSSNAGAVAERNQMAMETLEDLFKWLNSFESGCACGIFDATNTTAARRQAVVRRCAQESPPIQVLFVESICNDKEILQNNYRMKLFNEDYQGSDGAKAQTDFLQRVKEYEKVYEPITEEELDPSLTNMSFIKTIDAGHKVVTCGCLGLMCTHVTTLLHSVHLQPRKFSIVLAGESENDARGIRGEDTPLSPAGRQYAAAACDLLRSRQRIQGSRPPLVMTGTLRRYTSSVEVLCAGDDADAKQRKVLQIKALDELCFGSLEGLPGGKLRHSFPDEYAARAKDALNYRYPGVGGESYFDLIVRLREVVLTIERARRDLVVVCDVAAARVLLGYFEGVPIERIPEIASEQGVIELVRCHSGFSRRNFIVTTGLASMLTR